MSNFPHKPNYSYYDYRGKLCEVYYNPTFCWEEHPKGAIYLLVIGLGNSKLPLLKREKYDS